MPKDEKILIFADGASKGNPGKGGWGAIVSCGGRVTELGGSEPHTTNNRMELRAATEALTYAAQNLRGTPAALHTDSAYVINGITKWVAGWQKRGWVTQKNEPVLNRDLWEGLVVAVESLGAKVSWVHVGGHVGVAGNERVDEIASACTEGGAPTLFVGARADYSHDIENISHNVGKAQEKSSSKSRSGAKAFSYVSLVEGKIMTHRTWGECEARVKGKQARFKKALSPTDEAEIIKAFS